MGSIWDWEEVQEDMSEQMAARIRAGQGSDVDIRDVLDEHRIPLIIDRVLWLSTSEMQSTDTEEMSLCRANILKPTAEDIRGLPSSCLRQFNFYMSPLNAAIQMYFREEVRENRKRDAGNSKNVVGEFRYMKEASRSEFGNGRSSRRMSITADGVKDYGPRDFIRLHPGITVIDEVHARGSSSPILRPFKFPPPPIETFSKKADKSTSTSIDGNLPSSHIPPMDSDDIFPMDIDDESSWLSKALSEDDQTSGT